MTIQTDLATVVADVAAEISKATASITQAKANNDEGQELQAIEWLFAATQTQKDLAVLANDINPPAPPPPPPPPPPISGSFGIGFYESESGAAFKAETGVTPEFVMNFCNGATWSTIQGGGASIVSECKGQAPNLIAPVNICQNSTPTHNQTLFGEVANGQHDAVFQQFAKDLAAWTTGTVVCRLGWEMNLGWAPWAANSGQGGPQAEYVPCVQRVVTVMRAANPALKFLSFNPSWGDQGVGNLADYYPGDTYCDYVGLDVYDTYTKQVSPWNPTVWNAINAGPYGLEWIATFAQQHGKGIICPEVGLWTAGGSNPTGGGDDPTFVTNLIAWAKNAGAELNWWDADLSLGKAPNSLAAFKAAAG